MIKTALGSTDLGVWRAVVSAVYELSEVRQLQMHSAKHRMPTDLRCQTKIRMSGSVYYCRKRVFVHCVINISYGKHLVPRICFT